MSNWQNKHRIIKRLLQLPFFVMVYKMICWEWKSYKTQWTSLFQQITLHIHTLEWSVHNQFYSYTKNRPPTCRVYVYVSNPNTLSKIRKNSWWNTVSLSENNDRTIQHSHRILSANLCIGISDASINCLFFAGQQRTGADDAWALR